VQGWQETARSNGRSKPARPVDKPVAADQEALAFEQPESPKPTPPARKTAAKRGSRKVAGKRAGQ
jgi:hypothetical protein